MSLPFFPQPKPIARLTDRTAARAQAALAWRACCRIVEHRDGWRCRVCGRRVRKTLDLVPDRLEHHHLVPRSIAPRAVWTVANVITCCAACHDRLTRHALTVTGDANGALTIRESE